jgi:putative ATP-dependent endonuclease of OLD family
MRLKEISIQNFRKIEKLNLAFPKGLSVIVGENNAGKTSIIDALRLMLFRGNDYGALRIVEDDYKKNSNGAPIEISVRFCDLTDEEEAFFEECLVDIGNNMFDMWITTRAEFNAETQRSNMKTWGGETEGRSIPMNFYDKFACVYLQPLRDPENSLRPGLNSQIARLISCVSEGDCESHKEFERAVAASNEHIQALGPVALARTAINSQMISMAGKEMAQRTQLVFSNPTFNKIIAGLQAEIEELPLTLNGLGYNNLVYMATTLGMLKGGNRYFFRAILAEEPEAHLHPHLQVLLLRYLATVAEENEGKSLQVIASSHSPILVSQAPLDSIVHVHNEEERVVATPIYQIEDKTVFKKKLQRFLDATRAELFFARRILMVEGIAEALLLPILAEIAGGNLKESAVTILNVEGLNFNAFLPLFGGKKLQQRVVILTDGDDKINEGIPSEVTKQLKAKEEEIPNLRVFYSRNTFEHELACSSAMLPLMLDAYGLLHSKNGPELKNIIAGLGSDEEKADLFLKKFLESKTSKGQFAQEFAEILFKNVKELPSESVPQYIQEAFEYLGVIKRCSE